MNGTKENLKRIYDLSFLSMAEINAIIENAEKPARESIVSVENFARENNVSANIHKESTISQAVSKVIGVYLSSKYNCDFSNIRFPTVQEKSKYIFWYGIRDNIVDIYPIINAKTNKAIMSINSSLDHYKAQEWDIQGTKSFLNGRNDFKMTDDLCQLVSMVKTISDNFQKRC